MTAKILKIQRRIFGDLQKPNIIFMHVPKTGGTSVDQALSKIYGRKSSFFIDPILTSKAVNLLNQKDFENKPNKFQIREALLLCEMAKGTKYISGHCHFNLSIWEVYQSQYSWITLLRDPVKRYISQYFFDAFKPGEHARVNDSLDTFIETKRGKARGELYINYFSNCTYQDNIHPLQKLEMAKANFSKFALVGFLEDLHGFRQNIKQELGLAVNFPHKNKNPVSKPEISNSVQQKIEKICKYDSMFYSFAKDHFKNANINKMLK